MIHMDERFILILNGSLGHKWDTGLNPRESDYIKANSLSLHFFRSGNSRGDGKAFL